MNLQARSGINVQCDHPPCREPFAAIALPLATLLAEVALILAEAHERIDLDEPFCVRWRGDADNDAHCKHSCHEAGGQCMSHTLHQYSFLVVKVQSHKTAKSAQGQYDMPSS